MFYYFLAKIFQNFQMKMGNHLIRDDFRISKSRLFENRL